MFRHVPALAAEPVSVSGSNLTWVIIVAVVALLALGVAGVLVREVLAAGQGTQRMQEIARAVQEGAAAYLRRQFRTLGVFVIIIFFVLLVLPADGASVQWGRSIFFLVGALFSAVTGFVGMTLTTRGNVRVAAAAREGGERRAFRIAFRTGGVAGMFTVGLGLLGAAIVVLIYKSNAPSVLEGFGFGAAPLAPRRGDRSGMTAINRGFFISAIISAIGVAVACFTFLPAHFRSFTGVTDLGVRLYNGDPRWIAFGAILIGIVLASAIQLLTGYFTETNRRPVRDIGESSETGAATVILSGVSTGMESAVYSALLIGGAVFGAYLLATGNATIALFAVAMAGLGLLTTVGVIVSMDSFGPVTDNAQGIAEMSGDVEGDAAQALTTLDAIGNTTKAITKGIAIATAVLAATALFGSFRTSVESALSGQAAGTFNLDVAKPNILVGVIIGAAVVFLFASLLISAVGRAAQRVVIEVRNQFRNHPGIMDYTEKPDYIRVVDIVTRDSLRELITPGLLAVLAPIAVGFALGYQPLGSYLAGAIGVGVLMAVFLANSGGAWDNAKKLVEDGNHGGKGSEAHAATVVGDTVGDPFKDTAGPAINPLIKVMNLVSLLIATSVVKYSGNTGLRVGIAVGAVIVIVVAIVISKRRSAGMGEETPADTEVTGAVSPAVEGATTAPGIPAAPDAPEAAAEPTADRE